MTLHGAVIEEQGVTFAVVLVESSVTASSFLAADARATYRRLFPGLPVVLASQDPDGLLLFQGRDDLVTFLASMDAEDIPWEEFDFSS